MTKFMQYFQSYDIFHDYDAWYSLMWHVQKSSETSYLKSFFVQGHYIFQSIAMINNLFFLIHMVLKSVKALIWTLKNKLVKILPRVRLYSFYLIAVAYLTFRLPQGVRPSAFLYWIGK